MAVKKSKKAPACRLCPKTLEIRGGWMRDTGPCIAPDNAAILCYHIESLHLFDDLRQALAGI